MELAEIIIQYIQQPQTDFAVLINGEWGSGKTFFIKNTLNEKIQSIHWTNGKSKFEIIYVSVYGIRNSDELLKRIFLSLHPKLDNKIIQTAGNLVTKIGQVFKIKLELDDLVNIWGIPESKILVFDDLERLETSAINEILGVINSYTEHKNLKVIIIADEAKLIKKLDDKYPEVKEKLIRFTYHYQPDLDNIFETFSSRYTKTYKTFLNKHKHFVTSLLYAGEHLNLRTLRFILDLFEHIYTKVEASDFVLKEYKENIELHYLFFLITYSIEYKKGIDQCSLDSLEELSNDIASGFDLSLFDEILGDGTTSREKPNPSFKDDFQKKYFKDWLPKYKYFHFIAQYVHTGNLEENVLLEDAIMENDFLKSRVGQPHVLAFEKLKKIRAIEDDEFAPLIDEILNYVNEGRYLYNDYIELFQILEIISENKIGGFKIDASITKTFKQGIDITSTTTPYTQYLDTIMMHHQKKDWNEFENIKKYIASKNEEKKAQEDEEYIHRLFSNLTIDNCEQFYYEMSQDNAYLKRIFNNNIISPEKFLEIYLSLSNNEKTIVNNAVKFRNDKARLFSHTDYKDEIPFFGELNERITEYLGSHATTISSHNLEILQKGINTYLSFLENK